MKTPKTYINGQPSEGGQFVRARDILLRAGAYWELDNFGPFYPNKLRREFSIVETFVREGFEFTIIESKTLSLSLSLSPMSVSAPHRSREAWYQPAI